MRSNKEHDGNCTVCGNESKIEVTHSGEEFSKCSVCGNIVLYCKEVNLEDTQGICDIIFYELDLANPIDQWEYDRMINKLEAAGYSRNTIEESLEEYSAMLLHNGETIVLYGTGPLDEKIPSSIGLICYWGEWESDGSIKQGYYLNKVTLRNIETACSIEDNDNSVDDNDGDDYSEYSDTCGDNAYEDEYDDEYENEDAEDEYYDKEDDEYGYDEYRDDEDEYYDKKDDEYEDGDDEYEDDEYEDDDEEYEDAEYEKDEDEYKNDEDEYENDADEYENDEGEEYDNSIRDEDADNLNEGWPEKIDKDKYGDTNKENNINESSGGQVDNNNEEEQVNEKDYTDKETLDNKNIETNSNSNVPRIFSIRKKVYFDADGNTFVKLYDNTTLRLEGNEIVYTVKGKSSTVKIGIDGEMYSDAGIGGRETKKYQEIKRLIRNGLVDYLSYHKSNNIRE